MKKNKKGMTFDFVYYRCSLIYFLSSELEYGKVI